MTNWMTATGIALIAGGLATLICFRRVLWTGRGRGKAEAKRRATRAVLPVQPGAPEISADTRVDREWDDERAGLASIGLGDEDPVEPEEDPDSADPVVNNVDVSDAGVSDVDDVGAEASIRVARPRCDEEFDPPTGDYWMPVPESAYAGLDADGYGWPAPSNRDPDVESEPTAVVPTWPPARPFDRIELPRTWSEGPSRRTAARRWEEVDRNDDGRDGWRRTPGPDEEHLTFHAAEPRRRPRPRPNPTVYVSRHAAE